MNVVFNSDFLEDIKKLGNSVKLIKFYLEDYIKTDFGYTLDDIINLSNGYSPKTYYGQGNDDTFVRGIWDKDRKEFITHFSLPETIANIVHYDENDEPVELEFEYEENGEKRGNLVRVIRYVYNERNNEGRYKTAFLVTGNINGISRNYTIDPIRINQDRNIITISFPNYTEANILPYTVETDTKFLEGFGIDPGINIFLNSEKESLVSRESFYKYLRIYTGDLQNFQPPYIDSSGKEICKNYIYKDYKKLNIDCAGLFKFSTPKTKPGLNLDGGVLNIYGSAEYDEYILLGEELKYIGKGTDPINNVPNVVLEFSGNGKLNDVEIDNKVTGDGGSYSTDINRFRVRYGKYEEQEDPSKLLNFRLNFYDPILNVTKEITSKKIKITQQKEVLSEWEIFDKTTKYFEEEKPIYIFPWQEGFEHSFKIKTTLNNLSMDDFSIVCEDEYLNDLFKFSIEFARSTTYYPYCVYKVDIISKTSNEDLERWAPIINGESTLLLATIRLKDYEDYSESFYVVQSPRADNIELHERPDNFNVLSINFANEEKEKYYYPVAKEAKTEEEIGPRNTWKIFNKYSDITIIPTYGKLNANTIEGLKNELKLIIEKQSTTIEPIIFNNLLIGRIRENEININLEEANWRNIVSLSKISIPVTKDGIKLNLDLPESLILGKIDLYKLDIKSNGPIACYINYEEGFENKFSFFDPYNNSITYRNYFYSEEPNTPIYIALTDLDIVVDELMIVGKLEAVVVEEEPNWSNGKPSCFDSEDTRVCIIYQGNEYEKLVDYVKDDLDDNSKYGYVFLGPHTDTPIKYISTRSPNRVLTNIADHQSYHALNDIVMVKRTPTVEMNLENGYIDHTDLLQNPNNLTGFYPISPAARFTISPKEYNTSKSFFIFRKAQDPDFYSNDTSFDRDIYLPANSSDTSANKSIIIQSRYRVKDDGFQIRSYNQNNQTFRISYTEEILDVNDYKYKYTITISGLSNNSGNQRTLGIFSMISRIYKEDFINVNTVNSYDIQFYSFSQEEVDKIVQPRVLELSVIQLGTGISNSEIRVDGVRIMNINVGGESRVYRVSSNIPIEEPNIINPTNCTVTNLTENSFTINFPKRYDKFKPCIPSNYEGYSNLIQDKNSSFSIKINPVNPEYEQYNESLSFIQPGMKNGIIYYSVNMSSLLYIGDADYRIIETVDGSVTSFSSFIGLFSIIKQITSGMNGTINGIEITSNNSENKYRFFNDGATWYEGTNKENIMFTFPTNNTDKTIERIYTISYKMNGSILHQIRLIIQHQSSSGYFKCNNNMYVLSHGECLGETDLGWFDFETNIPINQISIVSASLEQPPTIIPKNSVKYQASIKLKPNLTEEKKTITLNFLRNGNVIKSITVYQGYYCTKLYYPDSNSYVVDGESLGNTNNYIDTPSRNEVNYGIYKSFNIDVVRCEPNIDGLWVLETNLLTRISAPIVVNYTWALLGVRNLNENEEEDTNQDDRSSNNINSDIINSTNNNDMQNKTTSSYFKSYNSVVVNSRTIYLENRYSVDPKYYGYEIKNKITVRLDIKYPDDNILAGHSVNPVFYIFQNKLGEINH